MFNLETNGFVVFPQLLVWEIKKIPAVGNAVGKGVEKNPTQTWPYLCGIFLELNFF